MGLNPLQLMKLFGMNQKFQKNHPKVSAFFRTQFAGGLTEDTGTQRHQAGRGDR